MGRIAPVSSLHGCERIAPDTHVAQAMALLPPSPWRRSRPRRTLVPRHVQWVNAQTYGCRFPAPVPCWLVSRAIRLIAIGDGGLTSNSVQLAVKEP
jgi:hypothetical protein